MPRGAREVHGRAIVRTLDSPGVVTTVSTVLIFGRGQACRWPLAHRMRTGRGFHTVVTTEPLVVEAYSGARGGDLRISVVIPALNEEAAIGGVVREVPRNLVDEIIVVDNGSTDRTAEIAAGARVVREPTRGYGAACLAGALAAGDTDILVFLDGDRNEDPAELPLVLGPVLAGEADLVLGARVRRGASRGTLTLQQ